MKFCRSILAIGLAVAIAYLPLYGATTAVLSMLSGAVAINGQAANIDSEVNVGDSVATGVGATASLALARGAVLAGPNTMFQVENGESAPQIRLERGFVEVSGMTSVVAGNQTVDPLTPSSRFNVESRGGSLRVEAVNGQVAIATVSGLKMLTAGEAITTPPAQASSAPAASMSSSGHHALLIVAITAAAAVATGIIVHESSKCSNCLPSTSTAK